MKFSIFGLCAVSVVGLAACVPVEFWYKPGVSPERPSVELNNCQVQAAKKVPAAPMIGQTPVYVTPVQTNCSGSGYGSYYSSTYRSSTNVSCTQTGGQVYGGQIYTYDGNAQLRNQVVAQCMSNKGYQYISVRQCEARDTQKGLPTYKVLPRLQSNSCVVPAAGGGWVFVNP